jgi:hypothetical protein
VVIVFGVVGGMKQQITHMRMVEVGAGDATNIQHNGRVANAPDPGGMIQYTWITFVMLKTTKTFELCNNGVAAADFAAAGAM